MNKRQPDQKASKKRPGRREMVAAKREASAMCTVEDLAKTLGVGRNVAYAMVQTKMVPALADREIGHREARGRRDGHHGLEKNEGPALGSKFSAGPNFFLPGRRTEGVLRGL